MIRELWGSKLTFSEILPEKRLTKILGDLFRVTNPLKMANYTIFLDVRKSEEGQASKKFDNKCSENSRSQIVFRTDIFQKLTLGAPDTTPTLFAVDTLCVHFHDVISYHCNSETC